MCLKNKMKYLSLAFLIGVIAVSCNKTQKESREVSASARFKMTTPVPEGIEVPEQLTSRIGTLRFLMFFRMIPQPARTVVR